MENLEQFLQRFSSASTKQNYIKALKHFEEFQKLNSSRHISTVLSAGEEQEKYQVLQDFIQFLSGKLSASVTKNYFDCCFNFLYYSGVKIEHQKKRYFLRFPKIHKKRFEGLDRDKIVLLLRSCTSPQFRCYLAMLAGSGLRESEALQIQKSDFRIVGDIAVCKVRSEITKTKEQRDTMVPAAVLEKYEFAESYSHAKLVYKEKLFSKLRRTAGLESPSRAARAQNDITLHSFRAYFISTFSDMGLTAFGHSLAGHRAYMDEYYRTSESDRLDNYRRAIKKLDFSKFL